MLAIYHLLVTSSWDSHGPSSPSTASLEAGVRKHLLADPRRKGRPSLDMASTCKPRKQPAGALQGALRPRASSLGLAVYLRQLGARLQRPSPHLPDPDFSSSVFTGPSALARKCRCSSGSCHVPSWCPLGCLWYFCTFKPSITTYAWVVPSVTPGFTFILSSLSALLHIFRV